MSNEEVDQERGPVHEADHEAKAHADARSEHEKALEDTLAAEGQEVPEPVDVDLAIMVKAAVFEAIDDIRGSVQMGQPMGQSMPPHQLGVGDQVALKIAQHEKAIGKLRKLKKFLDADRDGDVDVVDILKIMQEVGIFLG